MKQNKRNREQDRRLKLSPEEKRRVLEALADALWDTFDINDAGELRLSLILDVLEEPLAKVYYNRGVNDAARLAAARLEDLKALAF